MIGIPEFDTYQEREKWLIANAEGFTVVRKANRKTYKGRVRTLEQALSWGQDVVKLHPETRLLVYAVVGVHDCWCATISKDGVTGPHITAREGK